MNDRTAQPSAVQPRALLPTRRSAVTFCLLLTAGAALFVACFRFIFAVANMLIPDCPMNALLGLRCPLCGGTRCVRALVGLNIAEALYYNPLVVVAAVVLAYVLARIVISCFAREYKPFRLNIGRRGNWVLLAVVIGFYIIRNLPFYRAVLY